MKHACAFLLSLFLLTGCPDDSGGPDASVDAAIDAGARSDAGALELYVACEDTMPSEVTALAPVASTLVGAIVPDVDRVSAPGILNPATEGGELEYAGLGYDGYTRGAPIERVLRTDLGGDTPPDTGRRSLAYFVHVADTQLVDDESPTRLALVDTSAVPGGLRAQEAYLPRAMSAMNRTLARIERAERPYDFGVVTGDCADSSQRNELEWFIDLMNGAAGLHTDSGEDDDLIEGPDNDPKDPFDATAFPAEWLYVPGNHDVLVVGIGVPNAASETAAVGTGPTNGTRDYRRRWGAVTSRDVPADANREIIGRQAIVDMLLADEEGPGPVGHGYTSPADTTDGANYVYDAIPGLLRIIALDTSDDTGGSEGLVHRPTVDNFLVPQLAQAETDGVLVILASHHATSAIDVFEGQLGSDVVPDAVSATELESLVAGSPNVIAWLVGHNHRNRIVPIAGGDAEHPGYWEIMVSAIADYPSQSRIIEVVDNGDDTLSIFSTLIDFDEDSCEERRFRRLSIMEHVSAWTDPVTVPATHLNVELVIPTPPGAAAAIAAATSYDRIESETTLRGL